MKKLKFNESACTGCRTCVLSCSFAYHKVFSPGKSLIEVIEDDERGTFQLRVKDGCLACTVCEENCPFNVIKREKE